MITWWEGHVTLWGSFPNFKSPSCQLCWSQSTLTLEGHLRYPNIRREFGQLGSQAHDTLYPANSIQLTGFCLTGNQVTGFYLTANQLTGFYLTANPLTGFYLTAHCMAYWLCIELQSVDSKCRLTLNACIAWPKHRVNASYNKVITTQLNHLVLTKQLSHLASLAKYWLFDCEINGCIRLNFLFWAGSCLAFRQLQRTDSL